MCAFVTAVAALLACACVSLVACGEFKGDQRHEGRRVGRAGSRRCGGIRASEVEDKAEELEARADDADARANDAEEEAAEVTSKADATAEQADQTVEKTDDHEARLQAVEKRTGMPPP